MTALIKITYTGLEDSCIITVDAAAGTITSSIGASGAEVPDPNFGTAGVIDISDAVYDTVGEITDIIDGYDDYTAEIVAGDSSYSADAVSDQSLQAKTADAFIPITVNTLILLNDNALISYAEAKIWLPDLIQDDQQEYAYAMINAASDIANKYSGRKLSARDYTEQLDGNGKTYLLLPQYPINSVTELNIDADREFLAETKISSNDYVLYEGEGAIYYSLGFDTGHKNIKVVYNAGYQLTAVPNDLKTAVLETISWNWGRLRGNGIGIKTQDMNGMETAYELTVPVNAQRVFESYRKEFI